MDRPWHVDRFVPQAERHDVDWDRHHDLRGVAPCHQPATIYTAPEAGSTVVSKIVVDRSGGGSTTRKETTVQERQVK